MKSTCTKTGPGAAGVSRQRRGVAEVELILVIIVLLLPILLLVGASRSLGFYVLSTVFDAEDRVSRQVVPGGSVNVSADPLPYPGIIGVRPDLPNRYASERITRNAELDLGSMGASRFTYSAQAVFLDPSWHLSTFPASTESAADHAMMVDWFEQYVMESNPPELRHSLGLQPPGPP